MWGTSYSGPMQQTRAVGGAQTKFLLDESQLPRSWYNIRSDMPTAPQPVLHPGTGQPVGPDDLAPLFPMELIGQEVSEEPEIAIPEEVEDAAGRDDTAYSLGSVLNHVLLHQTVIGQEALAQMELGGAFPDVVVGCVGGGSNFAGLAFPFLREKIAGREIDVLACEPAACPTLTRGLYAYDFGDTSKLTPLVAMHTLGHDFVPAPIHAGGLRYHGVAPLISQLVRDGLIRAEAYLQNDVFASAVLFAGSEGILPAPEAAHAIHGTLQVAKTADDAGEEKTILFNLSGHGHFDMGAYDKYFAGELEDVDLDEGEIERALHAIEGLPTPA